MGMRRVATIIALAILTVSCVRPGRERSRGRVLCEFIVDNQTPLALEIRLVRNPSRTSPIGPPEPGESLTPPIGSINPGESLTHAEPCADRQVLVRGIVIPISVGATMRFRFVQNGVELVEGERPRVTLTYP